MIQQLKFMLHLKFVRVLFVRIMFVGLILQINGAYANDITSKPEKTILIVGDSLSMGHGIGLKNLWVTILQQEIKSKKYPYRIVNASIGGDTTLSGLNRLPKSLVAHQPQIVILELGANDGLRGLPLKQTKLNIEKMIKIIRQKNIKLLLIGMQLPPNYGPAYTEKFKLIYYELAKKYQVQFLPFMLTGVAGIKNYVQADGIHPNAPAQPLVFNNIWKKLKLMMN
ncbi:Arylesterase precursor [hydrothermal vent metagenome]|uniref:Arylesterase n=1 Tax=hydrothermal vent metagenome TaxID=652676 RepID=A0A3B0YW41_9ZZZZ